MTKFYNRVILMMLALMVSVSTFADDVEKGGIRYRVDWEKKEAVVICKDPEPRATEDNYSGDIVIPSVIDGGIAVTGIESEAFCYSGVTSISLPNSLVSIGDDAFRYSSLKTIVIPNSVKNIGKGAFSKCNMLTSVTISESVTSIGADAFYGAHRLSSIVVKEGNKVYDSRNNCNAIIETETNTLIAGCKNTIMPNTVMSIGDNAFYNCYDLASIAIPESVSSIGDWAFAGCRSLASITIPKSVTSIGDWAFGNCPFTSITNYSVVPQEISKYTFGRYGTFSAKATSVSRGDSEYDDDPGRYDAILHVLPGCKEAYEKAEYWNRFTIVEDAVLPTGINAVIVGATVSSDKIFSLSGQRLGKVQKGVNIVGGKKVLVK